MVRSYRRFPALRTLLVVLVAAPAVAADVTAPAEPRNLTVSPNGADLVLTWDPVTVDVTGSPESPTYRVYRGGSPGFVPDKTGGTNRIGTPATATFMDLGAATPGGDYFYLVSAIDAAGNESSTKPSRITTPPTLTGTWTDSSIDLQWSGAAPVNEIAAYRVYYGLASGHYDAVVSVGLATAYSLLGLTTGVNYYAVVTAVDSQGNESAFSNEHVDVVGGRITVRAHNDDYLCWGASKCPPDPGQVQRNDGWQLMVPTTFPDGDWKKVTVTYTIDSRLCNPPAQQNVSKCSDTNPCLYPPCNGGWNTCGDPWDRGAHLFLVLDDCIAAGGSCITPLNLELMRAVTPFGTDAPPPDGTGVVGPRVLTLDITPYAPLLTGTRYVGAEIGHYVQSGWHVTVDFNFSKRPEEASPKPPADGIQVLFFGGAPPAQASVAIPADATAVYTRLFTTGHGGTLYCDGGSNDGGTCTSSSNCPGGTCQNCDEFCHRTNRILVDGAIAWQGVPWRSDCSPGSVFACQGWNACGWPSCTFSRAGWCPGYIACQSNAPGCDQDLNMTPYLTPGATHTVDYSVLVQRGTWMVSLVAYWYR